MWIISRNENELLQVDGSWERRGLHCPKIFDSHEAANEWIGEQPIESVPKDFVSIACLESVLEEKHKDDNKLFKQLRKNKKSQRWNQYIELANPIDFYKSEDANEDVWASVFERFTATHLVIVEGDVAGVLGTTSLECLPFYSYLGEEYFEAFNNYTRQQPVAAIPD
jgi:hypothetical protein